MKRLLSTLTAVVTMTLPLQSSDKNMINANHGDYIKENIVQHIKPQHHKSYGYFGLSTKCVAFPAIKLGLLLNISKFYNLDVSSDLLYYSDSDCGVFLDQILEKRVNKTWYVGLGSNITTTLFDTPREVVAQPVFSVKKHIGQQAFIRFTSGLYYKPIYLVSTQDSQYTSDFIRAIPLGLSICTSF